MSEHDQIQYSIDIPADDKILDWIIGSATHVDANATPQPSSSAAKISRVPSKLSKIHNYEKYFAPQEVSIGPYHFGEPKLQAVEKLKPYIARDLFSNDQEALISLYKKLGEEEMLKDLRSFYEEDETTKCCDEVFVKMMLLDSCFIIYFLHEVYMRGTSYSLSLYRSFNRFLSVSGDLFLLENQIPFKLLKVVMSFLKTYNNFNNKIQEFIHDISILRSSDQKRTWLTGDNEPDHLLHLLYPTHIPNYGEFPIRYWSKEYNYNSKNFPTVNQLLDVGIHFKPCDPISLDNVRFSEGWFEFSAAVQLPPITMSSLTKPVLLNLIAYETCFFGEDAWFESYVCLLRSLIGNHEDVRFLKKAGVLQNNFNFGTDNDVVDFFNEIAADLIPRNAAYTELK